MHHVPYVFPSEHQLRVESVVLLVLHLLGLPHQEQEQEVPPVGLQPAVPGQPPPGEGVRPPAASGEPTVPHKFDPLDI